VVKVHREKNQGNKYLEMDEIRAKEKKEDNI
jgi:hypothetical protein